MFNENSCQKCGTCLIECPYIHLGKKNAKIEIKRLVNTRLKSDILKKCIECAYCDTICPTNSNPSELIREINAKQTNKSGIPDFYITSNKIPFNITSVALDLGGKELKKKIESYENPPESKTMFYLGCGLSYVQTDLTEMHILDEYPKIGGTKYCCGAYVKSFGEREIKIKGKNLLNQFLSLGIEKIIIFCPGCLRMMEMYSNLIPEFKEKIEIQTFSNYLIQKIENGDIFFKHKIDKNITFHDPCSWRNLSQIIFEGPRKLLNLLGAHVVEMEHNYKKTLCCGSPLLSSSEDYFNKVSGLRISEAQKAGADYIAVSCTGCLALAKPAQRENIEVYHILELVKKAFGDKIPHKIIEKSEKFNKEVKKILNKNPKIIAKRSIIRDGKLQNI